MITITTNKNTPGGKVLIGIIIAIFCLLNQGFSQKRPTQYDSTTAADIALSDIFINYDLDKVGDKTERISFYQLKQWLITQEIGYADSLKIVGDSLRLYQGTDSIAVDVSSLAGGGGGGGGGGGTDDQTLSFTSPNLSIENGNSVDISAIDTQLNESQVEAFIDGDEASFSGWDKNASDDFDGDFASLANIPAGLSDGDDVGASSVGIINTVNVSNGSGGFNQLSGLRIVNDSPGAGQVLVWHDSKKIHMLGQGGVEINSQTTPLVLDGNVEIETPHTFSFQTGGTSIDIILDEDDMISNDPNGLATQQSIKAYVDAQVLGSSTDDQTLSLVTNTLSIEDGNSVDLSGYLDNTDAQDLTLTGGTLAISGDPNTDVDLDSRYYTETETDALTWDASDIVTGTFADARISQSSVTQHLPIEYITIYASDFTTDITTGTGKSYYPMPFAATLVDVKVNLLTAGTTTGITVDINEDGTTVLSTKLTTDATEDTSETATTAAVISDATLADDAIISIDFDAVPTGGKGVIVTIGVTRL